MARTGSAAVAGAPRTLTFGGDASVEIPPGGEVWSDPVKLRVRRRADLAISVYVPGKSPNATFHSDTHQTNYQATGDHAADAGSAAFTTTTGHWFFLDSVDVATRAVRGSVVTLGDSITDGAASSLNTNHRWPDYLARRLLSAPHSTVRGVADEGISGNMVLADGNGQAAVNRVQRDVLSQPGVGTVILFEGINDLGTRPASGQDLIAAYKQMISRAKARGLRVSRLAGRPAEFRPRPWREAPVHDDWTISDH